MAHNDTDRERERQVKCALTKRSVLRGMAWIADVMLLDYTLKEWYFIKH